MIGNESNKTLKGTYLQQ